MIIQGYGLLAPLLSFGVGTTLCIPNSHSIQHPDSVCKFLQLTGAKSLMTVPSILEGISLLPRGQGVEILASLNFVAFGGGLLKESVGSSMSAAGVKLLNHYGSTESGPLTPIFVPDAQYDWHFFRLRKDIEMELTETNGEGEGNTKMYTLKLRPHGWDVDFELQDELVRNHDSEELEFAAVGRKDELVVLSNGEKMSPEVIETYLSGQQNIADAVVFSNENSEVGVIIKPSIPVSKAERRAFRTSIWPFIVEVNKLTDGFAQIPSELMVLIVPDEIELPRSDKGSVLRREVYQLFQSDIEKTNAYVNDGEDDPFPKLCSQSLENYIQEVIQTKLNWKISSLNWSTSDDLFELGMDSLQALQLRRAVERLTRSSANGTIDSSMLTMDFIYRNPSVDKIATALRGARADVIYNTRSEQIVGFVETYSKFRPKCLPRVLITGGTGNLGAHMVAQLATDPAVAEVVCLNRPGLLRTGLNASDRQKAALESRGIFLENEHWLKIKVFECDTWKLRLGLNREDYNNLATDMTHILHNAWSVDFTQPLLYFEHQFQTLQNLIVLAQEMSLHRPSKKPRLLFVSSIAVVGSNPLLGMVNPIVEKPVELVECCNTSGYAEAKLVCEKIIEMFAGRYNSSVELGYVRLGQITGSRHAGIWATKEHLPVLFQTAQLMGHLPAMEGVSMEGRHFRSVGDTLLTALRHYLGFQ